MGSSDMRRSLCPATRGERSQQVPHALIPLMKEVMARPELLDAETIGGHAKLLVAESYRATCFQVHGLQARQPPWGELGGLPFQ